VEPTASSNTANDAKHGGVEANQTIMLMAITLVAANETHVHLIMTKGTNSKLVTEGEGHRGQDMIVLMIVTTTKEMTIMEMVAVADEIVEHKIENANTHMMNMTIVSSPKITGNHQGDRKSCGHRTLNRRAHLMSSTRGLDFSMMRLATFFYDPKLKLYYGNEKQKYYEYCGESGARPPFREVDNQNQDSSATNNAVGGENGALAGDKVTLSGQDLIVQALQGGAASHGNMKKDEKKKIAICLKTKTSGGKNNAKSIMNKDKTNATSTLLASSRTEKKHNADIEKWVKRGKEAQDSSDTTKVNDRASEDAITPADTCKKVSTEVKTTTSGKPICLLCRRKFADIKKLRQHEKLSALHKENLLKQKKKTEQSDKITNKANTSDITSTEYRDRAKERRSMYGVETLSSVTSPSILNVESGPSLTNARVVTD